MMSTAAALLSAFLMMLNMPAGPAPVEEVEVITDRQYEQIVADALSRARTSIWVMMFEARYYDEHRSSPTNALIEALIAARRRGVEVKVILERRSENDRVSAGNLQTGALLSRGGVTVMYDPPATTTHSKLLIIDGAISVVGSTNWTYSALTKNHEVSVLIRSSKVARTLGDYFQHVWKSCAALN